MKLPLSFCCLLAALACAVRTTAQCHTFTHEHVDLLSVRWDPSGRALELLASDDDHGRLYASNQCVVRCPESMRFVVPAGTPLGQEGDPLWILPQNPYPGVPYVGASAESVPAGVFPSPFTIRLTRLDGPGHFLLWQAGTFGDFEMLIDTRDGIDTADALSLPAGGHAHFNWGFTTAGVYRAYFQVAVKPAGQAINAISADTPFTFHVEPLRPYEIWTATNWPCECAPHVIGDGADPDGDGLGNLAEYAIGADPHQAIRTNLPAVVIVNDRGTNYGAVRFVHATNATDVGLEVRSSPTPFHFPEILHQVTNRQTNGPGEIITVRDSLPLLATTNRFYQLRVTWPRP